MSRTAPLRINVGMAALARLRVHEELCRDLGAVHCLSRTREERAIYSVALSGLLIGGQLGILNPIRIAPTNLAHSPCRCAQRKDAYRKSGEGRDRASHSTCN